MDDFDSLLAENRTQAFIVIRDDAILDGRAHSIDIDELRITRFRDMTAGHEPNVY